MLVIFKSKAAAEVIMYPENAKPILDLLGKDTAKGIFTPEEAGSAIGAIEAEIARQEREATGTQRDDDDSPAGAARTVKFSTRAYPLLEMLRAAQRAGQPVVWGV